MIDRRDFIKAGMLAGILANSGRIAGAHQPPLKTQGTTLTLYFKGQFGYLVSPNNSKMPEAVCLKHSGNGPEHHGWLYLLRAHVRAQKEMPKPDDLSLKLWYGWKLQGGSVAFPGFVANLASKPADNLGRKKHWPKDVNNEADWESPQWIADMTQIAPGSKLKANWETEKAWSVKLPAGTFVGQKPCKKKDIVALWKWETPDDKILHLSAATDIVKFSSMVANATAVIELPSGGKITIGPGNIEAPILCAPDLPKPTGAYQPNDPIEHFKNFYRILDTHSNAEMRYLLPTRSETGLKPGKCKPPFSHRDDDIFCPGSTIPNP